MRMRRKKQLDERIKRLSNIILETDRTILNVKEAVKNPDYFDLKNVFGNIGSLSVEIGCGKGAFICELAKRHPEENFFAVEMLQNIIVTTAENVEKNGLKNVRLLNTGAEYLPRYIKPDSVKNIYLNFSPPYPQKSYECRRLTKDSLIENYRDFLISGGSVIQKTDDKDFFDYSFNQFVKFGFHVVDLSDEIDFDKDNIITEYESKFRAQNMPIYSLKATKK